MVRMLKLRVNSTGQKSLQKQQLCFMAADSVCGKSKAEFVPSPGCTCGVLLSCQVQKPSHNESLFAGSQQGEDGPRAPGDPAL